MRCIYIYQPLLVIGLADDYITGRDDSDRIDAITVTIGQTDMGKGSPMKAMKATKTMKNMKAMKATKTMKNMKAMKATKTVKPMKRAQSSTRASSKAVKGQ